MQTIYNDWVTAEVDEKGHKVEREQDALGRMVVVREYTGVSPNFALYATTQYAYDVKDQLLSITDAAGNQTSLVYDKLGRKVQMSDPDMGTWEYAYDALGNMTRQRDARGQRICFYYDSMNRVKGKMYRSDDVCPTPGPGYPLNVTYLYDNDLGDANTYNSWGRLRRAYVGSSYTTNGHEYKYDARGRTIWEKVWVDGAGYETAYTYDAMDRVKTMAYPGSPAEVVTYGYLPSGALNSVVGDTTYVGQTTYTAWGAVDLMKLGAAGSPVLQVDYTYYAWNGGSGEGQARLYRITAGTPGNPTSLQDLRYTDYDLVGNIVTIQDWKAGSPQTQSFTYDDLDRLLSAGASGGTYGNYGESYAYSGNEGKIGNLTGKGGVVYTYTDAAHKHAVTKLNGVQKYWYDANGNQVTRIVGSDTYALSYDAENRLTGVTKNGVSVATFVYGPAGERIKGVVSGVTTAYVGNHYEVQGGTIRKGRTAVRPYAGARRVAVREGNTLYWLLADHLGSTAITANADGSFKAEVRYKAWGEERYTSGTTPTTYRYTGQRAEAGIGLYYYNARWYDPALGRWVSPDTVIPQPSNPQSFNRYSYVYNNPLRYIDPTGHFTEDELVEWGIYTREELWAMANGIWGEGFAHWYRILMNAQVGDVLQWGNNDPRVFGEYYGVPNLGSPALRVDAREQSGMPACRLDDDMGSIDYHDISEIREMGYAFNDAAKAGQVPHYTLWRVDYEWTPDVVGAGLNTLSLVLNFTPETTLASSGVSIISLIKASEDLDADLSKGLEPGPLERAGIVASAVGIIPGAVGAIGDAAGIVCSLLHFDVHRTVKLTY